MSRQKVEGENLSFLQRLNQNLLLPFVESTTFERKN